MASAINAASGQQNIERERQRLNRGQGAKPAAEEQRDGDGREHQNVGPFGKHVERPAEAAEFGVIAGHQLGFGFRQIEGRAVGFGDARDDEDGEGHEHGAVIGEQKPDVAGLLRVDDVVHAEGAGDHDAGEQAEPERDFVADQLRGAAQRAEQRVVAVGGPAAEDDAEDAERRNGGDQQQADIHVGDENAARERQHGEADERGGERRTEAQTRRAACLAPVGTISSFNRSFKPSARG